jgi:hopanoid-associated phosphorylase
MLGILCGLESEAKIARRIPNALVACAAARPGKARLLARELVESGAARLVSFGVAGGLKLDLPIGAMLIGTHVIAETGVWECDASWAESLAKKLPLAQRGGFWGSETLVPTAEDKRALFERSGCLAVDMESQCAAEIAAEAKIPLVVMRTICDTANMNVPPVVMAAIGEDGRINAFRAMRHLAGRPRELPGLIHVMRGINAALGALQTSLPAFGNP